MDANEGIDQKQHPVGLRGWLVLVGIGVVLSPWAVLIAIYQFNYLPLTDSSIAELMDPSSPAYRPLFGPLIYAEFTVNIVLLVVSLVLIAGFFRMKRWFPRTYVAYSLAAVAVPVLDGLLAMAVFDEVASADIFDAEFTRHLIRALVNSTIWIPYMLVSRRVANTFTL